jgi:uncharacterized protein YcbX
VQAIDEGDEIASWISKYLERECRLVRMASDFKRPTPEDYNVQGVLSTTNFADGFPFLMTSEESLEDLNSKMAKPISMVRFRPNIVTR